MTSGSELFVGLVAAVGANLNGVTDSLRRRFEDFGFQFEEIRLSALLRKSTHWKDPSVADEAGRIENAQDVALTMRSEKGDASILARAAISELRYRRKTITRNGQPVVFILNQLKHPEEVSLLREVYGDAFVLVAGHAPKAKRRDSLAEIIADSQKRSLTNLHTATALKLVERDEDEGSDLGQNTRLTYPKADFFVDLERPFEVARFVDLLFGHPFHSPSQHEFAMFQASSVALRSSDRSRQVGAAIVKFGPRVGGRGPDLEVIATGMNEVPRGGGGYYWTFDSPDKRDQALGDKSRADKIKLTTLTELIERMQGQGLIAQGRLASELAQELLPKLKRTQFMDIGEFMRPVHAEMAAIIDASRRGVAVQSATMFVTTFPCHNCAKHIIAAGLRRVVYLEPYPKSRTQYLHREEVELDPEKPDVEHEDRVVMVPFSGLAPRQYRRLFSMEKRGASDEATWLRDLKSRKLIYQSPYAYSTYMAAEDNAVLQLPATYISTSS